MTVAFLAQRGGGIFAKRGRIESEACRQFTRSQRCFADPRAICFIVDSCVLAPIFPASRPAGRRR